VLEATTRRNHLLDLDLDGRRLDQLQSAIITKSKRRRKWATPETIFNALLALLL
jgi:proteinaceous RNase P